ncbi:MAG: Cna B-type domain-containing protein [Lachnospiraceae bacterium]|nr:Cna B-type domain-containing protein [Lachnospiraceae bacterium]
MQNHTEKRVAELLNAYRRKRKWKILTVILSVIVLFNTIYAMRDAAVAVTDSDAELAELQEVVDEAVRRSEAETGAPSEITAEFTPGETADTPADPAPEAGEDTPVQAEDETPAAQDPQPAEEQPAPADPQPAEENPLPADIPQPEETPADTDVVTDAEDADILLPADEEAVTEPEEDPEDAELPVEEEEELPEAEEEITLTTRVGETLIRVTFPADAFTEAVTLDARQITEEDGEEYEEIAALVYETAAEHDEFDAEDFSLFDIRFINEYGNVREPADGCSVSVSISVTGKETPDDVTEVLHIVEENGGLVAERMNADTNGYTAEFVTDSFSPYALVSAPSDAVLRAAPSQITGAYPTYLRVLDAQGNPVTEARYNDQVAVELGWNIRSANEVTTAGDYIVITLPDGLEFPNGTGSFKLSQAATVGSSTYPAGTEIATYTVNSSAKTLTVTYLEPAVRLIRARKILPAMTLYGKPWGELRFENVRVTAKSPFRPQIVLNGQAAQHSYVINILDRQPQQLTNVKITSFTVDNKVGTQGSPVEVGREDQVTINLSWEWKSATEYIGNGDYYRIVLHEALACRDMEYTTIDSRGNHINIKLDTQEVYISGYDSQRESRAVLTVTYLDVVGGYNESSGRIQTSAYVVVDDNDLNRTFPVWAKAITVKGNTVSVTSTANNYVRVKKGSQIPDGVWRLRGSTSDVNVTYDFVPFNKGYTLQADHIGKYGTTTPHLFVVADHGDNLTVYPFENAGATDVDFVPFSSNYMDAYCISPWSDPPIGGTSGNGRYDFSKATQYDLISLHEASAIYGGGSSSGSDGEWSAGAAAKLQRVLSVSFPYVSTSDMLGELQAYGGLSGSIRSISNDEATLAVQIALWRVAYDRGEDYANSYYKFRAASNVSTRSKVDEIATALTKYNPPTGNGGKDYALDGEPLLTFGTDSVTITGKIAPTPVPDSLTGVFSNESGTKKTNVTVNRNDGTFTATLTDVNVNDKFTVSFSGTVNDPTACRVLYFRNKSTIITPDANAAQDLIAAECGKRRVNFEWCSEGSRGIRIVKQFVDENDKVFVPDDAEVEITVYRYVPGGAREVWQVVKLNKANGYKWSAQGLPLKDKNGKYYRYDAVETGVPKGFTFIGSSVDQDGAVFVFTFKNREDTEEKTSLRVTKNWCGISDEEADRLSVRVALYRVNADGTKTQMKIKNLVATDTAEGRVVTGDFSTMEGDNVIETLKKSNNWTVLFEGLPKFEDDGVTLIKYEIVELDPPEGFTVTYEQPEMDAVSPEATVTNTKNVTKLRVVKRWAGVPDDLQDGLTAKVQLFRVNYFAAQGQNPTKTGIRSKDLTKVSEDTVNGAVYSGTYCVKRNQDASDGEEVIVTLSKANNWTVTFDNLPKYDDGDESLIQYVIQEIAVYDAQGKEVMADFAVTYGPAMFRDLMGRLYAQPNMTADVPEATVTNTTEGSLKVIKKWIDADGNEWTAVFPKEVIVELSATFLGKAVSAEQLAKYVNGPVRVSLTKDGGWTYTWGSVAHVPGLQYFIKEVVSNPANYDLVDENGNVINWTNVPVTYNQATKCWEVTLTNRRKSVEIELEKIDANDKTKLLPGAEFTLYRRDDMSKPLGTYETGADGTVKIPGLVQYTDYVLIETKWPEGYIEKNNPDPVIFRIEIRDGDNWIKIVSSPDYPADSWVVGLNERDLRLKLRIKNEKAYYKLPEAGGPGTNGYMAGGMSLMTATLLMYITWQFMLKRGKGGRQNNQDA